MTDSFYKALEDRFRGPEEEIKTRLQVYLPFVRGLKNLRSNLAALDLGCGRGEWLEVLAEEGVAAKGVDLDEGMVTAAREKGFDVAQDEALQTLEKQDAASLDILSAFHLVEHIPFSDLQNLVREAHRVLKPAGILIMETPNPDNLVVGATYFYTDPTHRNPLPSQLLAFLPEYYGFNRQTILGLQGPEGLQGADDITLGDVLFHPSPDYAVVAQAPADAEELAVLDEAFSLEKGVSLSDLVARFDESAAQVHNQVSEAQAEVAGHRQRAEFLERELEKAREALVEKDSELAAARARADQQANQLAEREQELGAVRKEVAERKGQAEAFQTQLVEIKEDLHQARKQAEQQRARGEKFQEIVDARDQEIRELKEIIAARDQALAQEKEHSNWLESGWNQSQAKVEDLEEELHHWQQTAKDLQRELGEVLASSSWRVTWPLRKISLFLRWLGRLPIIFLRSVTRFPARFARGVGRRLLSWLGKKPGLRERVSRIFRRFPRLHRYLKDSLLPGPVAQTGPSLGSLGPRFVSPAEGEYQGQAVAQSVPGVFRPGVPEIITVRVENESAFTWESTGEKPVRAAYHWYSPDGGTVVFEGERTDLPHSLEPGHQLEFEIQILPPNHPGEHSLMLTLVQEGVCWFEEAGFTVPVYEVSVDLNLPVTTRRVLEEMNHVIECEAWAEEADK
jgi:O-antigen chain-terminating methyltransferase